jgi:hypothetical protein
MQVSLTYLVYRASRVVADLPRVVQHGFEIGDQELHRVRALRGIGEIADVQGVHEFFGAVHGFPVSSGRVGAESPDQREFQARATHAGRGRLNRVTGPG